MFMISDIVSYISNNCTYVMFMLSDISNYSCTYFMFTVRGIVIIVLILCVWLLRGWFIRYAPLTEQLLEYPLVGNGIVFTS